MVLTEILFQRQPLLLWLSDESHFCCVCTAHCRHLVELGCIKPLCDLLTLMDSKIVQVALNGLENILRLGELEAKRGGGINPYCALIEEAYG